MNVHAVDHMARVNGGWGRMVWMSTFDSENQIRTNKSNAPFVRVSQNGALLPETKAVIAAIAKHSLVLASGHVSAQEALLMFEEGRRVGVRAMVATHGMSAPTSLTVEQARQAGRLAPSSSSPAARWRRQTRRPRSIASPATFARSASITPSSRPISARRAIRCRLTATRHIWRRYAGRGSRIRSSIGWQSKIRRGSWVFIGDRMRRLIARSCSALALFRRRGAEPLPNPPLFLYAAVGAGAGHLRRQRVTRIAHEDIERDPAVRRAVCLASSVDEVCLRRVEQRHAGRSSWRDGVPCRQGDRARSHRTDSRSRFVTGRSI